MAFSFILRKLREEKDIELWICLTAKTTSFASAKSKNLLKMISDTMVL